MERDSGGYRAGCAAVEGRAGSVAASLSAGCGQPDGAGRYAILLLECERHPVCDDHDAALPPGRYAVVLADATGAPLAGQIGIILAWDGADWKLAGVSVHQGMFDGHDGVWYWSRARGLAKVDPWSAWYSYDAARYQLLPLDVISSPNLEKLQHEQSEIQGSPQSAFPYSLTEGDRTWKIDAVLLDPTLQHADLAVAYGSAGVTDPSAQRTEAIAVLSAFLKAQPGIRSNFHGLWAYAVKDGKRTPVMELPMGQIP